MEKKHTTILLAGAVIILILLFTLILAPEEASAPVETEEVPSATTTAVGTVAIEDGATIDGGTIKILDPVETPTIEQPELNRPITIPDYYPKDAAKLLATKVADAIVAVEENPELFGNWLTLGNLRGQIEDYKGAVEIYEYLINTGTESQIPYTNLGNVYHYHLKDFPKAEENYKIAIEKSPGTENTYTELHALYKNVYKTETTLAADTLLAGLEQKPQSTNLMLLLATYYEDKGDTANQLIYLNKVLDEATRTGDTALASRINTEIKGIE